MTVIVKLVTLRKEMFARLYVMKDHIENLILNVCHVVQNVKPVLILQMLV